MTCCVTDDKSSSDEVESPYRVVGRRKRKPPVQFFYDDKVNSATPNWIRAALTWVLMFVRLQLGIMSSHITGVGTHDVNVCMCDVWFVVCLILIWCLVNTDSWHLAGYSSVIRTNDIVCANVRMNERLCIFEVIHQTGRTYKSAKNVRKFTKGVEVSYEQNSV